MKIIAASIAVVAAAALLSASALADPASQPATRAAAPTTAAWASALKDKLKSVGVRIEYDGPVKNHYFSPTILFLGGRVVSASRYSPYISVPDDQAVKIIDHLAASGFLDRAKQIADKRASTAATAPRYTLTVELGPKGEQALLWQEYLGWGQEALPRLEALRGVTSGDAREVMDSLIAVLRKEFPAKP